MTTQYLEVREMQRQATSVQARLDTQQAKIEDVAFLVNNRDKTGLIRSWPHDGTYEAFLQSDLLLEVRAVLKKYQRYSL